MIDFEKYENLIKSRLSEYRYIHSMNVSKSAVALAGKYGADPEKARLAGILHDVMKEEELSVQYDYIRKNGEELTAARLLNNSVIHQMSGAAYCRLELGIDDKDVLGAIRYHTTGRRDMTLLEQVVYTADFISADRNYPDVEKMRELADESLDEAMLYSLKYTINKLVGAELIVEPDTLECYNFILEKKLSNK